MKFDYNSIGNFKTPYIIAEIGANHNGDINLAKKIIDAAVEAGADAVKFQSWSDKSLISEDEYDNNQQYNDSPKKHFGSLKEMVQEYYLREDEHFKLKQYCDEKNIEFCSTPFSKREVDLLTKLDVPFFKVASMDINNFDLLTHIGEQNKPIILSTGMSTIGEIEKAVQTIEKTGNYKIIIFHTVSIYPPKAETINLNNIHTLRKLYPEYTIGFSDHTIGTSIPLASIALGAGVIEKHFTLDKDLPGWDHEVSANPSEMEYIVKKSKEIVQSLGSFKRVVSSDEEAKKLKFRRSAVVNRDMSEGEIITNEDILFKRPGTHISPEEKKYLIGRKLNKNISKDRLINWSDLN